MGAISGLSKNVCEGVNLWNAMGAVKAFFDTSVVA